MSDYKTEINELYDEVEAAILNGYSAMGDEVTTVPMLSVEKVLAVFQRYVQSETTKAKFEGATATLQRLTEDNYFSDESIESINRYIAQLQAEVAKL